MTSLLHALAAGAVSGRALGALGAAAALGLSRTWAATVANVPFM
ncbi:hypothetical protein [Streptomyces bobili]|nr:hypothetical protein [Streptomyces bobili]